MPFLDLWARNLSRNVLFDEDTQTMTGFQNLEMAAKYMRQVYG